MTQSTDGGRSRLAELYGFDDSDGRDGAFDRHLDDDTVDALADLPDVVHELRSLRRILGANRRLARAESLDQLRDCCLDDALRLCDGDAAAILVEDGGLVVARARDTGGARPADVERELAFSLARRVHAEDRVERVVDASVEFADGFEAVERMRSALYVPLSGRTREVLAVWSRREAGAFDHSDADRLALYAQQVALQMDRLHLFLDVARQRRDLLRTSERAERLNRRLAETLTRRTAELQDVKEALDRADTDYHQRFEDIVGRGPTTLELLRQVDRVAATDVPVLLEGESGTGKELLARATHRASARSAKRFVAENCAALPDSLLENELFGHERGAFTGADAAAVGLFERADGGTLFLDEVGDMTPKLQKRLLRVIQEGEVRRVGGSEVRKVDVRIVTATNRDLRALVRQGRFREDLYYRLAVVRIRVPPLRERREDIPALVAHFLERVAGEEHDVQVTEEALQALIAHRWPGNVRQLENEVRRAVALARGPIELASLSRDVRELGGDLSDLLEEPVTGLEGRDLKSLVEELEVRVLRAALERERGNITRTAKTLGLSRLGLRKKMQRYGVEKPTTGRG